MYNNVDELAADWSNCTKCSLAIRRNANDIPVIAGRGKPGGIMLIGDKPTEDDEQEGDVQAGRAGALLQDIMRSLGMADYPIYMTNVLGCRSCSPAVGLDGLPITRKLGRRVIPVWRDEAPLSEQINACAERLYEEIYMIDPVVIVAMGSTAIEFLTKKSITLFKDHGAIKDIHVPGRGYLPSITEKKQQWIRKYKGGVWEAPVVRNQVTYVCVVTYSPAYILSKLHDETSENPVKHFGNDLQIAAKIYEQYRYETQGCLTVEEYQENTDEEDEAD